MYAISAKQRKRARVQSIATELYSNRYGQLLSIAQRNAPTRADAEEALQEAFVSFIAHFDPDSGAPPIAWVVLTLKRTCWAKARNGNRELSADNFGPWEVRADRSRLDEAASLGTDMAERIETVHAAREAMTSLKSDQRKALLLLGLGYSYKEICELTGWTYTKVNRCISEGRMALREVR